MVEMTSRSGFLAGLSEARAVRMEVAAEAQRVFSVKTLNMPMPEMMRSAWARTLCTGEVSSTSPLVIVRWDEMVD